MSFLKASALALLVSTVAAHGVVTGIFADGVYHQGFSTSFANMTDPPKVGGWSTTYTDMGFVGPEEYTSEDIICHKGATPGKAMVTIAAGGTLDVQWNGWPESHKGPVMDYLAPCNGDCTTVKKADLKFFKIDESGLKDGSIIPGKYASDDLIANNNTWSLTIPTTIAPGNYVLRHEIIALHSASDLDGAQNYPQCFNLKITGSGNVSPEGLAATELYTPTEDGIEFNIYRKLTSYPIPGPTPSLKGGNGKEVSSANKRRHARDLVC